MLKKMSTSGGTRGITSVNAPLQGHFAENGTSILGCSGRQPPCSERSASVRAALGKCAQDTYVPMPHQAVRALQGWMVVVEPSAPQNGGKRAFLANIGTEARPYHE